MKYLSCTIIVYTICINLFCNHNLKVQADSSHNVTNKILNTTKMNETSIATSSDTVSVAAEGGAISFSKEKSTTKFDSGQDNNMMTHKGRENVTDKPTRIVENNNNSTLSSNNNTKTSVVVSSSTTTVTTPVSSSSQKSIIPVIETSEHSVIVARKGVNYTNFDNNSTKSIPEKVRPKKPQFTESDDTPFTPHKEEEGASVRHMMEKEKRKNSADYVVPIVAVILSVPLVAIILSVLYKRGSEWWQHRHYRRMDFLIEGMYNN